MKKINHRLRYRVLLAAAVVIVIAYAAYNLFSPLSGSNERECVYIDADDDVDSVCIRLSAFARRSQFGVLKTMFRHSRYSDNIKTGRYVVEPSDGVLKVFKTLKNGLQTPVMVTVPSVRSLDQMAAKVAGYLMADSADIMDAIKDAASKEKYGFNEATMPCMIIPNTYDMYWNVSATNFLARMQKEYDAFWNGERKEKADAMGLTPVEVSTLASIVDEETANNAEKPTIAGLYYNRLQRGMRLQADPTVKFAMNDPSIRRVLNRMLTTDSPYNTYMYEGLPPGPIRVPSVQGIDAVLNYQHHNYLYMCAKEDFSGTHNFASTAAEHAANARRYAAALNARGIR